MPPQMDLMLQTVCCYVICTRLVVEAAVKTINELCYICDFSDARRKIPGVTTEFSDMR